MNILYLLIQIYTIYKGFSTWPITSINRLVKRQKIIGNYFDKQLVIKSFLKQKKPNILCFQLLEYEDLLLFFVMDDSNMNIFGFGTVGQVKERGFEDLTLDSKTTIGIFSLFSDML